MSSRAWFYVLGIIAAGAILGAVALSQATASWGEVQVFAVMAVSATFSQVYKSLFKSKVESDDATYSFSPILVFLFAGVLLLSSGSFVLLVLVPHLVEWIKERLQKSPNLPNWYIQPFNISTHIFCGLTAQRTYLTLRAHPLLAQMPSELVAILAAILVYVLLNHFLIGQALVLARQMTWRELEVWGLDNLLPDVIMLCLGGSAALLWGLNPWLILLSLASLLLLQRSLMIPQLKQEARVDAKTGLWNAHYFDEVFKAEFNRATRFERPVAVLMGDLDRFNDINNTFGHLAGDQVLNQVGRIIRECNREYDIAGRFGGEEFVLVLPETKPEEAQVVAERLRAVIEATEFHAKTNPTPIHVTISLGIANYPSDAATRTALIHAADLAMYHSKFKGRNCVSAYSDLPHSVQLETEPRQALAAEEDAGASSSPRDSVPPSIEAIPTAWAKTDAQSNTAQRATASLAETTPRANDPADMGHSVTPTPALPSPSPDAKPSPTLKVIPPSQVKLFIFLGIVIAAGCLLCFRAFVFEPSPDLVTIGLFVLLAILAEVLHLDTSEDYNVSVSVAVNFAAALTAGLPGLVLVSGADAITHRLQQSAPLKPAIYKTAFNWSSHILAGLPAVLAIQWLAVPLDVSNLAILLVPIALTSLLYFLVESGLIALAITLSQGSNFIKLWTENFRWVTGHYLVLCMMGLLMAVAFRAQGIMGIIVFAVPPLMMRYAQQQYVERTRGSMRELKRLNDQLTQANAEIVRASQSIQQLNDELFVTLAKIIDARDPYVSGHASKVADYAMAIGQEFGLSAAQTNQLRQAALLHDIGKLGIPESILHKPSRLTDQEYEILKKHAVLGADFLLTSQGLKPLARLVRHHHERWDGMGYPDQLAGVQIPLEARILAVCDAVEAMASDRPYHQAMSLAQIITEVKRSAGTQFDPTVAEAFIRVAKNSRMELVVNSAREVRQKNAQADDLLRQFRSSNLPPNPGLAFVPINPAE